MIQTLKTIGENIGRVWVLLKVEDRLGLLRLLHLVNQLRADPLGNKLTCIAATQSQTPKAAAPASSTSAPTQSSSSAPAPPAGSSQKIQDFFDSIQTDSQPTMFGGPPQQYVSLGRTKPC
jgi:hypothetical protein